MPENSTPEELLKEARSKYPIQDIQILDQPQWNLGEKRKDPWAWTELTKINVNYERGVNSLRVA